MPKSLAEFDSAVKHDAKRRANCRGRRSKSFYFAEEKIEYNRDGIQRKRRWNVDASLPENFHSKFMAKI